MTVRARGLKSASTKVLAVGLPGRNGQVVDKLVDKQIHLRANQPSQRAFDSIV